MASRLADELLKEILSPPLLVPDELFADTGAVSPFSKATYSAADVLLVCKRWMRVATPALYATVVIRSLAQAQALAFALKRNPDFGRYIKKLRLEGAFGQHLAVLATAAPNITDLCFSLALYADSNVKGLVKLLGAVSPERAILTTAPAKIIKNKGHAEVLSTLCSSIPRWSRLHTFHFASSLTTARRYNTTSELEIYNEISTALASSTSLRTIHLRWYYYGGNNSVLEILAGNRYVETYCITVGCSYSTEFSLSALPHEMRSRAFIVGGRDSTSKALEPIVENPFYTPMSNATDSVRTIIWTRILEYAVEAAYSHLGYTTWFDTQHYSERAAVSVLRVSKAFQAMTVRILSRHIMIEGLHAYKTATRYFEQFQIPAIAVQTLKLSDVKFDVSPLVSRLKELRSASVFARSDLLALVGRASGAMLEGLTVFSYVAGSLPVAVLRPFTHIVTLRWKTTKTLADTDPPLAYAPNIELPRLRTIEQMSGNVLDGLARCEMRNLEEVHNARPWLEAEKFLKMHGSRVKRYIAYSPSRPWLDALINLESLVVNGSASVGQDPSVFQGGHATLRVLSLPWIPAQPRNKSVVDHWQALFDNVTRHAYSSLKEIRLTYPCEIWPSNEREIKKSPWPDYAAGLAAEGITLLDHTGRAWRPRLSARR
ncbi:hypothetical protein EXIGLDRAFT_834366 [Exidia glandulosa HHB12029]|uniref:Uncharacterized protein n=1 Tax=Exidia glandulosa HHB12029 TaxID=1314781 RepID=A0A165JV87_EXIGL|nr:hypothetical protein EXIGLDRAFT_834366 [Exidia glandulosa HHB12029]